MLVHLWWLLRHGHTGVLRAIRTSKWREGTSTRVACVVMQRQRVLVVTAPSGLDGSTKDMRESRTPALMILLATPGEESDHKEDQTDHCDPTHHASSYGALVGLLR